MFGKRDHRTAVVPLVGFFSLLCLRIETVANSPVEPCRQNNSDTKFINNGYEGLLVLVGDEVKEDYNLIEDLRILLNATSRRLFQVTNRRAYIRQVSVLLPRSWGIPPKQLQDILKVKTDSVHSGERGDFRLRNRSPKSEDEDVSWELGDEEASVDTPYVIKATPCGYSGRYLRMTPEFVRFGSRTEEALGSPEKIMVQQWAKLRWGVYEEIPLEDSPSNFYTHSDLTIQPVACSREIKGKIINSEDPTQSCSPENALNDKKCDFIPNFSPTTIANAKKTDTKEHGYGSLMYRSNLEYVKYFCDTEEESEEIIPPERQHNPEAPTMHNLHCQGKSIWEVMRTHPDFSNGNNPPMDADEPPPIDFSLLQNPDRRIVLVLDVSTSMKLFNRMKLMRQAASQFIETVPEHSWIGIVTFAAEATIMSELVEITNNDVRRVLKQRLPNLLVTGTSIGSGIKLALKVLKSSGPKHMRNSGGSMLVLSDGKEHNAPKINDTLREVRDFGVRVTTIAFGALVADDLEVLAELTGGSSFFASSGDFSDNSQLRDAFLATIESKEDDIVVVSSQSVKIRKNSSIEHGFLIDERSGSETRITVLYTDSVPPMIGLQNPMGEIMWEYDEIGSTNITADFSWDREFSTKTIQYFSYMEPGIWNLLLKNQRVRNDIVVDITVFSRPSEQHESLTISPALLCRVINLTGGENEVIYAHLSVGEFAVLDADVQAVVTRPLSLTGSYDTAVVRLKDDGRGADVIADDGIYSGYFTSFTLRGRYNVKVNASDGGTARLDTSYILGIGHRRDDLIPVSTKDLLQKTTEEEPKVKSRERRAIKSGFLKPFRRWSTQQKEFVVNDIAANVCPEGYQHFQDNCYKFVRSPMQSIIGASTVCSKEGGYLAEVNSNQELLYLMDSVKRRDTWFGGIDEDLNVDEIFSVKRSRRESEDVDLLAITDLFKLVYLDKDLRKAVESFEPDWKGLSRKEINRIIRNLGVTRVEDIKVLKEEKLLNQQNLDGWATTTESGRVRRQAETPPVMSGDDDIELTTVETETTPIAIVENATLSLAQKVPDQIDFEGSGVLKPECSWFNDGRIVETSGEICRLRKAFFCERPKIDLLPPSRIIDFRITKTKDPQIVKFTWTATGDDNTNGRATRYEIRNLRTRKARKLERNFKLGEKLTHSAIYEGTIKDPKVSGLKEELMVNLTRISDCPAHAAVDLILILPIQLLTPKQMIASQREAAFEMLRTLLTIFKISTYEIQVSVVAANNQTGKVILQDSISSEESINSIRGGVEEDNVMGQEVTQRDLAKILDELTTGGRRDIPKVVLSLLSDSNKETAASLRSVTDATVTVVGIGISNEMEIREVVSEPKCDNSIFVQNWQQLNETVGRLANQICRARRDEYQAWGIIALDEEGLRSDPSNIISAVIENRPEPVICPEPTSPPQPNVAGGPDPMTVGLAVGIPLGLLLSIIGVVMLFGQVKKYRKKKREAKERKAREAEEAAAEARRAEAIKNARVKNVKTNMMGLLQSVRQNSNLKVKVNKTAPISGPPV